MPTAFQTEYDRQVADHRIEPEPEQVSVIAALERLSTEIAAPKRRRSLFAVSNSRSDIRGVYIWGRVGRGKSMLMNLFFDQVSEPLKRRLHFHAFMAEVHASMQPTRDDPSQDSVVRADPIAAAAEALSQGARLLCIDELEVTDIADAMILGRLFDQLFDQGLILVATSNEDPDHLYDRGPNRELFIPFVERLKAHVQVVQLGGAHDHRSDGIEGLSTYFSPITKENAARFDRLWKNTLENGSEGPSSIPVHGRELQLSRTCRRHARVTFDEVCRRALSADDHLALAEHFTAIFLEGLPKIDIEHADEGRRLVTLIDALYESNARLVVLAATEPDGIFEDVSSDDHQRTVSRLNEMRDASWARHVQQS